MTLTALLLPGGVGYTEMTADTVAAVLEEERGGRGTGSRQAGEDGGGVMEGEEEEELKVR